MKPSSQPIVGDRFELLPEYRRGGMGTVWKARDLRSRQLVAVKILHEVGPEQTSRFVREGALLAELSHPRIVSYVAHGTTAEGLPYLVMQWLDGENVAERLARQPLTLHESLALLRGVLQGLAMAHRLGIVHRDLKPSNLFLRNQRIDDVVLLDLGIARYAGGASSLTRLGTILGTPSYMAPEQAQGQIDLGTSADVFSLGCVLYECLTGEPPFVGEQVLTVLAKVLFEESPRLRDTRPEMPEAVGALIERMLMKDPERRFPDAAALIAALDAIGAHPDLEGPHAPVGASPPSSNPEQELVSVILATPDVGTGPLGGAASFDTLLPEPGPEPKLPEVAVYGGVLKRLVDGTIVITVGQGGGAATDLAARAARCVLRLQQSLPAWRFVLATGRGIPNERSYIGEAVDRAGILLRSQGDDAGPVIWLDAITAGLLDARFRTIRVGEGVFVLEGEDPSIDPARRLLGRPTTCVGREHELGMLDLALRACTAESTPRAVLLVGPPGIGKSRVRHEFLRHVQQADCETLVLVGLCDPIRIDGTRTVLAGAVARFCGIRSDMSDNDKRAALHDRIGRRLPAQQSAQQRQRTIVFMGELCDLSHPADTIPELRAAQQNAGVMADLVTQAWLAFLRAEATAGPVVLVLDDLQWCDGRTIALVESALRELTSSPLMVLALGRPEVLDLFPELWAPRLATLPLHPLGPVATARLIRQVLGQGVSDDSVNRMIARAGGNALYLEELIRAAEARRDAIPETVLAMLQARIGLLPAPTRRVLRAASVFGEDFPIGGVQALLRAAAAEGDLELSLASLSKHEIVEQQTDELGRARWRFRHALMRDAAYALLTAEDLAVSHGLAAQFLELAEEDPAVIGAHCQRAGDGAGAVRHYSAAAEQAAARNDLATVLSLVKQGVACGAAGVDLGMLRCIEAETRFFQNDFAGSFGASTEALQLLPAGHPRRISSLAWHTFVAMQLGRGGETEARMNELLAAEPAHADRATYVLALGYALISYSVTGNRSQASRLLARIMTVDGETGGADPLVHGFAMYWKLRFLELLGDDPYEMWHAAREAARCHELSGDRRMLAFAQVEIGECARRLYSLDEGYASMRPAVNLARELREPITIAFTLQYLATLLAEHGEARELAEACELAEAVIEQAGPSVYRSFGQVSLALAKLRGGELVEAERLAREARSTLQGISLRSYFPHADAALIQVLLGKGDSSAAQVADEALNVVHELGPMGLMEMPLRLWVARAHAAAGRREDAARGVAEALARLSHRAAKIDDAAMRARFHTEVPEHAALHALSAELSA